MSEKPTPFDNVDAEANAVLDALKLTPAEREWAQMAAVTLMGVMVEKWTKDLPRLGLRTIALPASAAFMLVSLNALDRCEPEMRDEAVRQLLRRLA